MPSIAVLGCGYWGQNHIKTLKSLGHLYGVADIDMAKANGMASKYSTRAIALENLFKVKEIDALILALPPQFHTQNAILAIENNKDVFIEKPIALEVAHGELIIEKATKYGAIIMVGHILRFHSAFEQLEQQLALNVIGDLKYINAKRWGFGKFHAKSDAMWDLAPHDLSLILALLKKMPNKVNVDGCKILESKFDFTQIAMEFDGLAKATLSVSRLSPYCERKFMVVGTKAIVIWDDMQDWNKKLAVYNYNVKQDSSECKEPTYIEVKETMALTEELKHFIACVKNRTTPRTPASEGLAVLNILSKAAK